MSCTKAPPETKPQAAPETVSVVDGDEWCAEHKIAEAECPFCDPSLIESLGWCGGHDVPEAFCTRCNERLIPAFKSVNDWCEEHGLPETQCDLCEAASTEGVGGGSRLVSLEDIPRDQRSPAVQCATNQKQVRFITADIAKKVGLAYAKVESRPVTATLECNAEIAFDRTRYARMSSRVAGVVHSVVKDLGDQVTAGDALAVIDSTELSSAWADYLRTRALFQLADKNHDRVHGLVVKGIATEQNDLESEAKLEESRIAMARAEHGLRNLGVPQEEVEQFQTAGGTHSLLTIRAPFDGIVVERTAVVGEAVSAYQPMFAIADMSKMWAMLDVYEADLDKIAVGQPVLFDVPGMPGDRFGGRITWISAEVDETTRTLKARAELDNAGGLLRANMFGRAEVRIHDQEMLTMVPKSAVQWEGCCNIVFVKQNDLLFLPRKVRLGYATDNHFAVLSGVKPGDTVVTQGSFLLKTEILKGSIGQGCCEAGGGKE